jgi:hypothetical protein
VGGLGGFGVGRGKEWRQRVHVGWGFLPKSMRAERRANDANRCDRAGYKPGNYGLKPAPLNSDFYRRWRR